MIIVGDLHIKRKEPYFSSIRKFLEWLINNYKEETFIFLGDIHDSSSPHGDSEHFISSLLKQLKKVYIIPGNHDISRKQGNSLLQLETHDNITVCEDRVYEIENYTCFIAPYLDLNMKEYYEQKEFMEFDYVFTHITPKEYQFNEEGILLNLKAKGIFHGHIHIPSPIEFIDKNSNKNYGTPVPIPTRHLEDNQEHFIYKLENNNIDKIEVPFYFKYETLEFGEKPENKDNILNIKNAPSVHSVYTEYKDYFIRDEGISIKLEEDNTVREVLDATEDIKNVFIKFCKEKEIQKEYIDCCLEFV